MRLAVCVDAKLAGVPIIRRTVRRHSLAAVVVVVVAGVALAACGGSSKPSYCSQVNNLKTSVTDLGKVNPIKNGTSALTSALQKVQSNAKSVVDSAKSDFPSQTSAINDSVSALETTAKQLVSNPAQPSLIAQLPGQVSALTTSIKTFISDTSSKCG
jgi:predicted PurR-regulated permease PerM